MKFKEMSQIYHGSIEVVETPEIRQPNRSLDYGLGFYTTTSFAQAKKYQYADPYTGIKDIQISGSISISHRKGVDRHKVHRINRNKAMSAPITQDNLYLLLPCKIGWLARWMVEDNDISIAEAINRIYHSKLYKKLSSESTKYWHLGPVDLYNELKQEL